MPAERPLWRESLEEGWSVFAGQPVPFLLASLIYGIAASALAGASNYALRGFGVAAVFVLLGPWLGGTALMVAQARRGAPVDLNVAFAPWQRAGDHLVVGLALGAGLLALGIGVLLSLTLFMFAPVLVAEGEGYAAALGRSRELVMAHLAQVLPVAGAILVATAVSVLVTYSVGLLVVVPVGVAVVDRLLSRLRDLPEAPAKGPFEGPGDGSSERG